jgi:hypothetical protein
MPETPFTFELDLPHTIVARTAIDRSTLIIGIQDAYDLMQMINNKLEDLAALGHAMPVPGGVMKIIQPDDGSVQVQVFPKGMPANGDEGFGQQGLIIYLLDAALDARFHVELDYLDEHGKTDRDTWDTEPGQTSIERQREVDMHPAPGMKALEVRVTKI